MPDVQHSTLTGAELHEVKGAAAATAGQVLTADGAGNSSFDAPVVDPSDGSAGQVAKSDGAGDVTWAFPTYTITSAIADISTAETVYLPVPYSGNVVSVVTVLEGAISVSDATITVKDNAGNAMAAITVANAGSAAGDVDSATPASNQDVTDNDFITIETDGASTNNVRLAFVIVIERDD